MTKREQQIVDYIESYWEENWTSPTVREICTKVGLASTATVHHYLTRLTLAGVLEKKSIRPSRVLYRVRAHD